MTGKMISNQQVSLLDINYRQTAYKFNLKTEQLFYSRNSQVPTGYDTRDVKKVAIGTVMNDP